MMYIAAHHDHQALLEKLENAYREVDSEKNNLERSKRESLTRADQDRNSANQLRDELNKLKAKLEETKNKGDDERIKLELKIEENLKEKEALQKELEELRVQFHMAEDRVDSLQNQLQDTNRKLKEGLFEL